MHNECIYIIINICCVNWCFLAIRIAFRFIPDTLYKPYWKLVRPRCHVFGQKVPHSGILDILSAQNITFRIYTEWEHGRKWKYSVIII